MHGRITRIAAKPDGLEAAIATFEQNIASQYRQLPGFAGIALAVDREKGTGVGVTFWESEEALKATDQLAADLRSRSSAEQGVEFPEVEEYELALFERLQPAKAGTCIRTSTAQTSPERLDDVVGIFKEQLPTISSQKGLRSLSIGVNRQNGKFFVTTVWDTPADREATEELVLSVMRPKVADVAQISPPPLENYDVVYADIPMRASVS